MREVRVSRGSLSPSPTIKLYRSSENFVTNLLFSPPSFPMIVYDNDVIPRKFVEIFFLNVYIKVESEGKTAAKISWFENCIMSSLLNTTVYWLSILLNLISGTVPLNTLLVPLLISQFPLRTFNDCWNGQMVIL